MNIKIGNVSVQASPVSLLLNTVMSIMSTCV